MSTKLSSTMCMKCHPTTVTHNEVRKWEHYSWNGVIRFPNTFSSASFENPDEQTETQPNNQATESLAKVGCY